MFSYTLYLKQFTKSYSGAKGPSYLYTAHEKNSSIQTTSLQPVVL